jgi:HEAT repeat protein
MRYFVLCTLFTLLLGFSVFAQPGQPSAEETEKNLKILQKIFSNGQNEKISDEQLHTASEAIRQLTQLGTAAAVPELKKLLDIEQLNTVVRTALTNIPHNAGISALRESLAVLQGKNLAGVVESLGSVRDENSVNAIINLTGSADPIVVKSAILSLGKIATSESVDALLKILADTNSKYRADAADAALLAAEQILAINQKTAALKIFETLKNYKEFSAVQIAAARFSILLDEDKGLPLFVELLTSNDNQQWKLVLAIANQLQSPRTGKLILGNLASLPNDKKAALLEIIGIRKDTAVVDALIQYASGDELLTKTAAVKALGRIGDLKGIDVILSAVGSSDETLAAAGKESLSLLQGTEFNTTIVKILDSKEKVLRLAALQVIGERRIKEGTAKTKQLFGDTDADIRTTAYRVFSQSIVATTADLELLLNRFQDGVKKNRPETEQNELREALKTVCRKIPVRDESVVVIEKLLQKPDVSALGYKEFLLELLFFVGGEKAGKAIADAARSPEEAVADQATKLLGQWSYPDVAPYLIDLAENHPAEKYRIRTLRGYIRIIRQMGLPLEQKAEMIQKAEAVAKRDDDKKLIAETKSRIQNQLKGKPIFDGKTFDGWEFRGNEQWFRIEDNAIVAGTLKKRIDRNEFICTTKEYGDFTLRLEVKVIGKGANAGVQFRSQRLAKDSKKPNEVSGYQADMTDTEQYWGCLYDESRRNKFLADAKLEEIKSIFRPNDWNELEIVCKGDNVKLYLNGKQTIDYTETNSEIPRKGIIGLQIHGGPESESWYRNIRIEE